MRFWLVAALVVLGVLLQGGAVTYYLVAVPPKLADDYRERAEPRQAAVDRAVTPVAATFDDVTFGTRDIDDDLKPREFLRRFRRVARQDKRELAKAVRGVRRAKRVLARVDADAMTDVPDWPLLGGRGDLEEAEAVAEKADAYLRKARAFVRDYDRLLKYWGTLVRLGERVTLTTVEAYAEIPRLISSHEQFTGPAGRAIRVATTQLERLRRLEAPAPLRKEHRRTVALTRRDIAAQRAMSAAVRRDDFATANRIRERLRRQAKREDRRGRVELQRFLANSRYRRQIADLARRDLAISNDFDEL